MGARSPSSIPRSWRPRPSGRAITVHQPDETIDVVDLLLRHRSGDQVLQPTGRRGDVRPEPAVEDFGSGWTAGTIDDRDDRQAVDATGPLDRLDGGDRLPAQGALLAREAGTILAWDEGNQLYLLSIQGESLSFSRVPNRILAGAISDDGSLIALLVEAEEAGLLLLNADFDVEHERPPRPRRRS